MLCGNFWIAVNWCPHLRFHGSAGIFTLSKINQFDRVLIFFTFAFFNKILGGFGFPFCLSSFLLCRFPSRFHLRLSLSLFLTVRRLLVGFVLRFVLFFFFY